MDHRIALERVLAWARDNPDIRVMVLTGSLARNDGSADEYSDLDLELYVADPSTLLESDAWYRQFEEVLVVEALENPGWHPTRLVYYANGKVDFMIAPTSALADGVSYDQPFQVMIDKDSVQAAFRAAPPAQRQPPTSTEFLKCINWFYAAVLMWAKYLARADLWAAKVREWDSKTQLLRMIEWDHKARKGWDYDTWYLGLRLHHWVDPELTGQIEECWSGPSFEDQARALWASLSLFDELSMRTARALEIKPFDSARVRERVEYLLGQVEETDQPLRT